MNVEEPVEKIRVTFLSRTTKARRVLNEDDLVEALRGVEGLTVTKIDFHYKMDFLQQLDVSLTAVSSHDPMLSSSTSVLTESTRSVFFI